ncbi:MAG: ParB/RepB/Spo0J family partition protein [Thaumarchaeota archaeon]|nr:ParB/RepB/Spo0J family partition protein [Nitrososphaerota archaeon]
MCKYDDTVSIGRCDSMSDHLLMGSAALSGYIEQVDARKIRPSKTPLRNDSGLLGELTASILEKGLLEPIVVRPIGNTFEVVAGNRRLEACRRLKFGRIPCHIVELDDREAYEVSLTENLHRKTLNPIEEGLAFKKYVDKFGYGSASDLARRIDKSPSYVSRRIALLDLPEKIREQLLLRGAKVGIAEELLSLDEESKVELTELITEMKITSRSEVRRLVGYLNRSAEDGSKGVGEPHGSYYEIVETRARVIERTLTKCIASLRQNMGRFDDAMGSLPGDDSNSWVVSEALMWQRRFMNGQVDDLIKLRKKFRLAFKSSR